MNEVIFNMFFFRHSRESGNPWLRRRAALAWTPAFAGVTNWFEVDQALSGQALRP
jgi:hypothetical protein